MKTVQRNIALFALIMVSALSGARAATVFDFANLTYNGGNNAGFLPTNGVACTGGDLCSSNVASALGGALSFTSGGISVDALGSYNGSAYGTNAAVVQDHENAYNSSSQIGAGLGVYSKLNNNADDNITSKEAIKLHFDQAVVLSAIGLRSDGHNTSWGSKATFEYSLDSSHWTSAKLTGNFALNQTGQDFYFRYGGKDASQFYLGSATVAAVPEPATYAMLLGGLGLMGFMARRRRLLSV